jgi:hypothetical protein
MVEGLLLSSTDYSDPTVKQLILRMNERQHDLIIEVCLRLINC